MPNPIFRPNNQIELSRPISAEPPHRPQESLSLDESNEIPSVRKAAFAGARGGAGIATLIVIPLGCALEPVVDKTEFNRTPPEERIFFGPRQSPVGVFKTAVRHPIAIFHHPPVVQNKASGLVAAALGFCLIGMFVGGIVGGIAGGFIGSLDKKAYQEETLQEALHQLNMESNRPPLILLPGQKPPEDEKPA